MTTASARQRRIIAVLAVVVLLIVITGISLALFSADGKKKSTTAPPVPAGRCPLTDLPAAGNKVPDRPPVAVKIGNEPEGARPQSGLNEADIVYDTPAEGFIQRYMAVYQCASASSIGPTRSVRWVDSRILQQFPHSILAFAGGITFDVDPLSSLPWLSPADLLTTAQSAGVRITTRVPPDNLYTSTSALHGLFPHLTGAPPAVFRYTTALPKSAVATSALGINFSNGTDVVWKWDSSTNSWLHTYAGTTDVDALTNQPVTATNVIVQIVRWNYGPYVESTGGTGDIESHTVGSGSGYVLRNGRSIKVTWHRASLTDPTTFTDATGHTVGLAPGRTWVEIVRNDVANAPGGITLKP